LSRKDFAQASPPSSQKKGRNQGHPTPAPYSPLSRTRRQHVLSIPRAMLAGTSNLVPPTYRLAFAEYTVKRATSRALPLWVHMWLPWDAIAYPLLTVQTRMILAKDVDISYPDLVLDHIAPNGIHLPSSRPETLNTKLAFLCLPEHLENFWDAGWGLVILEHAITAHAFEWLAQRGDPTLWEGTLFLAAVDVMLHPLTVLRVNLQSGKFNNATQCIRAIYQQDGLYGFFKGWTVAVTSACFELGLDLLISRITQ